MAAPVWALWAPGALRLGGRPGAAAAAAAGAAAAVSAAWGAAARRGVAGSRLELSDESPPAAEVGARELQARRLLYRSRQRGWLELDLIVGQFAERELPRMDDRELAEYGRLLGQENPDFFKWLTGQKEPPANVAEMGAFRALRGHVLDRLQEHSPAATRSQAGQEWVRGWDDGGRKGASPRGYPQGNQ